MRVRLLPLLLLCLAFAQPARAFVVPIDGTLTVASLANQTSLRAADIDRDGDLDLVSITESAGGAVRWFENANGSGTSWTPHTIATKASTGSTATPVDLDGDGDIDVLATLPSANATVWYENTSGNGSTWAAAEIINDTASGHVSSAAGDFDRDGDLDVVIGSSGTIRWFVNFNGDASDWSAANGVGTLAGASAVHVEVADIDRDGRLDVAAAWDGTSKGVGWYRNTGSSFAQAAFDALGGDAPRKVAVARVDRDADLDLVVVTVGGQVLWLENANGVGTSLTQHSIASGGSGGLSAVPADIDNDGDLDVVVPFPADLVWYENADSFGTSWIARSVPIPGASVVKSASVADIDSDGDPDVIGTTTGAVFLDRNVSVHASASVTGQPVANAGNGDVVSAVALADVDGDGDDDAIGANYTTDSVTWYSNNFGTGWAPTTVTSSLGGAWDLDTADFDRDGDPDIVAVGTGGDQVRWYANSSSGASFSATTISGSRPGPAATNAADIDSDGDPDVLVAFGGDGSFAWYENTEGDGSAWSEHVIGGPVSQAIDVVAFDVDRDGDLDIFGLSVGDQTLHWYENTAGNGSAWSTHVISVATSFAVAVAIADVDGDGDVDAASYGSNQKLAWYENTAGNGSAWTATTISALSSQGRALVFTDFDRDGDADLVAAPGNTSAATFWENGDGNGDAWVEHALAGPAFPTSWQQAIAVGRIDTGGTPDLVIAHGDASQLTWYANALRNVRFTTANLAPSALLQATAATVLSIDVTHQGRPGDAPALFDTLLLQLTDGVSSSGLSSGQAGALIAALSLFADDGDLVPDAGDTLVGGLASFSIPAFGFQSLDLNAALPQLQIATGQTKRFFIAIELQSNAASQTPRTLRIAASGDFTDNWPAPLSRLEQGVPTRRIAAASTTSDFDVDGVRDLAESDTDTYVSPSNTGSDPFDADSDDDGFADGFEVVRRTNPNLLASAPPAMAFSAVEAGLSHSSCGILSDGELSCWGSNDTGLGTPPAGAFRRVSIGDGFACGLGADSALSCWGDNTWRVVDALDPNYAQIAAGQQHVCGIRVDLTLECWGTNSFGLFTPPAGLYRGVTSGEDFSCALDLAGGAVCWGNPADGRTTPPPGERFVELDAGSAHACGVLAGGTVLCWGLATSGQTTVPAQSFTHVAAGQNFSCGTRSDGALQCWGGAELTDTPASPYVAVSAGRTHVCALRADGHVACMLNDESGEATPRVVAFRDLALGGLHGCSLGASRRLKCFGDTGFGLATPPVMGDVAALGLGDQHSCAIEQSGDAICFGANTNGEAGGTHDANGNPFVQIDGGTGHTCGVRADSSVTCWGSNASGQGTPDAGSYVQVSAGGINSANAHTCGITTAGALRCWGTNVSGQATDQSGTWTQVSAGQAFTCGVRSDGTLGCFGQNLALQVSGAPPGIFSEVAAGRFHACAREPNGTVRCWGDSSSGKTAPPPGKFVRIAAAGDRSCGVLEKGSIACWGANAIGEVWPPLDVDHDTREDAADNCPVAENPAQTDADLDGVGDAVCDLCLGLYDPDGIDRDGDGIGDACDNCVDAYNPGQEDDLGPPNGIGNACESTVVFIRPTVPPPPPGPPPGAPSAPGIPAPPPAGEARYDVFLYCPATAIDKVQLGVIMPQGATSANVNFGLGCTASSCAGAVGNGLGATVSPGSSFAKGPDPAFASSGARGDTVYFSLQAPPAGTLCDPDGPEIEVRVAQFQIANPLADMPTPSLTKEGLSAPPVNMLQPLVDDTGRVLEPAEYSFASLNQDPSVALTLAPAAGDATGRRWQVELDTDLELYRVTFGLLAPAATTTAQMRFTGCTTPSGPQPTRRSCVANPALGPYVSPAASYTIGPSAATSGLRTDALYVTVGGARPSGAAQPALNVAGQPVVLGVVELDTTTVAPALTLDGVGTTAVFGPAYVATNNTTVSTPLVQVGSGYNAPSDYDADGRSDDLDNCPYTANANQANNGGFLTTTPDLYGDLCQCADGDGNGAVFAADTAALRSVLTGQASTAVTSRCSVAGGPECDVRDYAVFKRALAGLGPGISSVCASAVRGAQLPAAP